MNEIGVVVIIFAVSAIINLAAILWTLHHKFMNKHKRFLYLLTDDEGAFYHTAVHPETLEGFKHKFNIQSPGLRIIKLVEDDDRIYL